MLLIMILTALSLALESQTENHKGLYLPEYGITLVPESERTLDTLVLGLSEQDNQYFLLPELRFDPAASSGLQELLESEFFDMNFELTQGGIMRCLPAHTQVYIAVPDADVNKNSFGHEIPYFKEYLTRRCGWTQEQIRDRIHFFKVPTSLIWAQDAGVILGYDNKGRVVIGISHQDQPQYISFVEALAADYPDRFRLWWLPDNLSAEGGDITQVLAPDGKNAFVVGPHRIRFYLEHRYDESFEKKAISKARILEAKNALSKGFSGLPVLSCPKRH